MIRSTPRIEALPASTPFVGPEALARAQGIDELALLRLGANESSFGASPAVYTALADTMRSISLYGDPTSYALRGKLAAKLACSPAELVIGNGIDGLIELFIRAYVGEGGTALATEGTYPTFFYHLAAHGAACITVPYAGTRPHLEELARAAHIHKPKLVYVANPDNPGGGYYTQDEITAFCATIPTDTVVLLDEAYAEYIPGDGEAPLHRQANLVRMRTFSKVYGLAGLRIGYALADAPVIAQLEKIRQHFGISRTATVAALAALDDQAFVANVVTETARGRAEYADIGSKLGIATYPSVTNFVLFEFGDAARAAAVVGELLRQGVFIRKPGLGPLASCVRISVGHAEERLRLREAFVEVLAAASLPERPA